MKILLLGSLISATAMEELNNNSREKASIAPVNYETMLAKGLHENGVDIEAFSVPAVAAFPNSRYKKILARSEKLDFGVSVKWIPFVNIQFLKQLSIKRHTTKMLKQWLKENRDLEEKMVVMYSIYPPYSKPAIKLCKKYGCHLNTIITDLPEYMYTWKGSAGLRGLYARYLKKQMLELQSQCDSYILFTEKMATRMGVTEKPYMVSEGFGDISVYDGIDEQTKYEKKTVVYAGNLSKLYGVRTLLDGFMLTHGDYELHLYGAGPDVAYIEECANKDTRIKFFGRVSRKVILTELKKAHLLIINKPTADDYSNYSFSSKILEYMLSGTPVLTTKVGGMPQEYYQYFYFIEDETPEGISESIITVLKQPDIVLEKEGMEAKNFAIREKNYIAMTAKIKGFLEQQL